MTTSTLHVIGPPDWVAEEFRRGLEDGRDRMTEDGRRSRRIIAHDGLSPAQEIGDADAVWCAPGTLIALDDWRRRCGLPPLPLAAPPADAITRLPYGLVRHRVLVAHAGDVLSGRAFPAFQPDLGERPWSRVASGRVGGFRAARRGMDELRSDLTRAHAPADSLIEVAGNVDGLVEEWCAVVKPSTGTTVACSGVCVHPTPGGMDVVTVFDGARFDPRHRRAVLDVAAATARALDAETAADWETSDVRGTGPIRAADEAGDAIDTFRRARPPARRCRPAPPPMSLLLGFAQGEATPVVLEIDPVWCTTPYPFGREGMEAFVDAIARCRIVPQTDIGRIPDDPSPDGGLHDDTFVWSPDPWMVREFSRRYRGFAAVSAGVQPSSWSENRPGNRRPDTA